MALQGPDCGGLPPCTSTKSTSRTAGKLVFQRYRLLERAKLAAVIAVVYQEHRDGNPVQTKSVHVLGHGAGENQALDPAVLKFHPQIGDG